MSKDRWGSVNGHFPYDKSSHGMGRSESTVWIFSRQLWRVVETEELRGMMKVAIVTVWTVPWLMKGLCLEGNAWHSVWGTEDWGREEHHRRLDNPMTRTTGQWKDLPESEEMLRPRDCGGEKDGDPPSKLCRKCPGMVRGVWVCVWWLRGGGIL